MSTYTLETGSTIIFHKGLVLSPDKVTELLANEASSALNEHTVNGKPLHFLELGIGTGAFSRSVLDQVDATLDVVGIHTDTNAIQIARTNLEHHKRLGKLSLSVSDWYDEDVWDSGPYDCVYFN